MIINNKYFSFTKYNKKSLLKFISRYFNNGFIIFFYLVANKLQTKIFINFFFLGISYIPKLLQSP